MKARSALTGVHKKGKWVQRKIELYLKEANSVQNTALHEESDFSSKQGFTRRKRFQLETGLYTKKAISARNRALREESKFSSKQGFT